MGTGVTVACPHCGQETDGTLRYCQSCGKPLATDERQGVGLPSWLRPAALGDAPVTPGVKAQLIARLVAVAPSVTHQTQGREFPLDGHDVRIGRAPSCDINLDGDPLVSRFHALLRANDGGYVISDLNSSNGTLVNDAEVHTDTPVREGDEITIGECKLRIATGYFEINTGQVEQPQAAPSLSPSGNMSTAAPSASSAPAAPEFPVYTPVESGLGASNLDPFPPLFDQPTGPVPLAGAPPAEPEAPPPPKIPTPEELRDQAAQVSAQLAQQAREAILGAERYRDALEDSRQRVVSALSQQPNADRVTYHGDLPGLRDLVGKVVENPHHLEYVTRLAGAAAQLAEALDTLHATEPYAELLGALADLRKRLDDALA